MKPKPAGEARFRGPRVHDWVEVDDATFGGGPDLPQRRRDGQAWPEGMQEKWDAWRSMPHAALWSSRTLVLRGSGSVREELVRVDRPHSFGYTMSHITGPLSALVSWIEGEFLFRPAGTGTSITWRFILHARSALAGPVLPVIGWSWHGYARQALEELAEVLVA
jgi:hypothetical protein